MLHILFYLLAVVYSRCAFLSVSISDCAVLHAIVDVIVAFGVKSSICHLYCEPCHHQSYQVIVALTEQSHHFISQVQMKRANVSVLVLIVWLGLWNDTSNVWSLSPAMAWIIVNISTTKIHMANESNRWNLKETLQWAACQRNHLFRKKKHFQLMLTKNIGEKRRRRRAVSLPGISRHFVLVRKMANE